MHVKFFTIPLSQAEDYEQEINAFLSSHKIVETEKQLIQSNGQAYWCMYIGYIQNNNGYNKTSKPYIDYKKQLPPKEFERFEQLRKIRIEIANEDTIAAYVVADNKALAEIAQLPQITLAALKKIKGFGTKKVESYGKRIIEKMKRYETGS